LSQFDLPSALMSAETEAGVVAIPPVVLSENGLDDG
jgi:hypothetical protein